MKGQRELAFFVALAIFLSAPYVPNSILKATINTYVGVALLLVIVLVAVRQDMVVALAVFLAAGALFLENRKRLVAGSTSSVAQGATNSQPAPVAALSVPAPPVEEGEIHPDFEEPSRESYGFEPTDDTGSNDFRAVGTSIDMKEPLETAVSNSSARAAQQFA